VTDRVSARLLVVGLNPAWQKTLQFDRFDYGGINRATAASDRVAGKGINCAQALVRLGGRPTVAQFAGGHTGECVCAGLDHLGILHLTVHTQSHTRVCTTVLSRADRTMTELIEPSGAVSPTEVAELRRRVMDSLPVCQAVAICGTYPPGVPATLYADIVRAGCASSALVVLDACRGVEPALAAGPSVVKINRTELLGLAGSGDEETVAAARRLLGRFPIGVLAVTAGPDAACLVGRRRAWSFAVPRLADVANPLGAGDCATAGLLLHALTAWPAPDLGGTPLPADEVWVEPFRQALACASASCLTTGPAEFDPRTAAELAPQVRVSELPSV
jgi:tagatose 6-phosphate kinase